jgi:hypothetical protein
MHTVFDKCQPSGYARIEAVNVSAPLNWPDKPKPGEKGTAEIIYPVTRIVSLLQNK